ncbi:MAG: hypothetical protein FWG02_00370 [Holophagaceae bacterium]|nr:hypothetical protein [Holophagaceae bacterium]
MTKVCLKHVATLLLSVVCAHFGHLLAEGLAHHDPGSASQLLIIVSQHEDTDLGGHHHEHGISCDQWLCSGFSGIILGTESVIGNNSIREKSAYFDYAKNEKFLSRTIEPRPNPPRT